MKNYQKRFLLEEVNPKIYFEKYDAVVVLGAVMKWNPNAGRWSFPIVIEEYAGKLVMGEYRALAASEFHHHSQILLVTGGSDTHPVTKEKHSRSAELIKRIKKLKVPENKLVNIGQIGSSHTQGNIENTVVFLSQNPDLLQEGKIGLLSPTFQARRAKIMWNDANYFKDKGLTLDILLVEDILTEKYPDMIRAFEFIYSSPEADFCLEMEKKGIKDYQDKSYKTKNPESIK